jgi:hypothetical protein
VSAANFYETLARSPDRAATISRERHRTIFCERSVEGALAPKVIKQSRFSLFDSIFGYWDVTCT